MMVKNAVKDLVAGSGLRFEARGQRKLKRVPEEWNVFGQDMLFYTHTGHPDDRLALRGFHPRVEVAVLRLLRRSRIILDDNDTRGSHTDPRYPPHRVSGFALIEADFLLSQNCNAAVASQAGQ